MTEGEIAAYQKGVKDTIEYLLEKLVVLDRTPVVTTIDFNSVRIIDQVLKELLEKRS